MSFPKISKLFFIFFIFYFVLAQFIARSFIFTSPVFAAEDPAWDKTGDFKTVAGFADLEGLLEKVLGGIFRLGLIAVFVMLLYGGFSYLTAGGNPESNQKAGNVITYAILGLVLMIGAWFILRLIENFTGITITDFSIMF